MFVCLSKKCSTVLTNVNQTGKRSEQKKIAIQGKQRRIQEGSPLREEVKRTTRIQQQARRGELAGVVVGVGELGVTACVGG